VVIQCYDGDTPRFWVSFGLDQYGWVDVRLRGVKAAEMNSRDPEERGRAIMARDHLISLLSPLGHKQVRLYTERVSGLSEENTLGRLVATSGTRSRVWDLQQGSRVKLGPPYVAGSIECYVDTWHSDYHSVNLILQSGKVELKLENLPPDLELEVVR
jgi:hypothetical protein